MEPTSLLQTVVGAIAGKVPLNHLWLLAVAIVLWWVWREGFFRPIRRKYRRS